MTGVPTTPTSLDRTEDIRILNIEIAKLTSTKEIANKARLEAEASVEDAKKRAKALEDDIGTLEASFSEMSEGTRSFLDTCRKAVEEGRKAVEDVGRAAKALADEVTRLSERIEALKREEALVLENIAREGEEISRKRRDLDIYHKRILKAASTHMPGQKVEI